MVEVSGGAVLGGNVGAVDELADALEIDDVLGREVEIVDARLAAEREGPSNAATAADRSMELDGDSVDTTGFDFAFAFGSEGLRFMNDLNSYFADLGVNLRMLNGAG